MIWQVIFKGRIMKFKPIWMAMVLFPALVFSSESNELIYVKLSNQLLQGQTTFKEIALHKVHPSKQLINQLKFRAQKAFTQPMPLDVLPAQVDLGMNKVPVLDQGPFGTCVTFSTIAALDALKGQGDYYSQLCLLNLGKYLKNNGYRDSGWDGEVLFTIINRVNDFGLVSVKKQREVGCGGGKIYPLRRSDTTNPMSMDSYHQLSEALPNNIHFSHDFRCYDYQRPNMEQILNRTKKTLAKGGRLIIGMFMPSDGTLGLDGNYKQSHDTWVLSDKLQQRLINDDYFWDILAGHAMVIIGYDDKAQVIDNAGKTHQGLFKVRNSWSKNYGDHGNFYITYDYFKTMVGELVAVE